MSNITSIKAAVQAKSPIVALPLEGHAPLCIRHKLLKAALKGVEILSAEVIVRDAGNRAIKIMGRAGNVRTSCTLYAMDRRTAQNELGKWADKERAKATKKAMLGALATPQGRKAAKLAEMEGYVCEELTAAKAAASRILHPTKLLTSANMRTSDGGESISEGLRTHMVANHALPSHIIKQCAVLRYRNAQTTVLIRKVAKYDPSRRSTTKRAYLKAKAAGQLIALVRELMERKAEYARIAPPALPHPLYPDCDHMAIHAEWPYIKAKAYVFDAASTMRMRQNKADSLREIRATIKALTPPPDAPTPLPMQVATLPINVASPRVRKLSALEREVRKEDAKQARLLREMHNCKGHCSDVPSIVWRELRYAQRKAATDGYGGRDDRTGAIALPMMHYDFRFCSCYRRGITQAHEAVYDDIDTATANYLADRLRDQARSNVA